MPFAPTKRKKHRRERSKEMVLQITSLVDVFTILLIFLLKTYSTGFIMQIVESIKLPVSSARAELSPAVTVALNRQRLFVDGELLVPDLAPYEKADDLLVQPLFAALKTQADRLKRVSAANPNVVFTGEVIIQSDRQVPFRLLKKIIYTAGQAEYVNQSMAVVQRSE
ncbi:MAG: biopolymer transporter ExbD [Deltaproteobacteria bacterium]|nr:biopolymer transporter ExbD [Deltaproteobacteria bacterium]